MLKSQLKEKENGLLHCTAEFKGVDGDAGIVEGLASTFELDIEDDKIHPGAFAKTVKERVPAGRVPFLESHSWSARSVLGTVVEARETEKGLWFRAKMSAAASAQEIRQKMLEGHLKFLSIGFQTVNRTIEEVLVEGVRKYIRHIHELKLFEISVVPIPANEGSRIQTVKSFAEPTLQALIESIVQGDNPDTFNPLKEGIKALADRLPEHQRLEFLQSLLTPAAEPGDEKTAEPPVTPVLTVDADQRKQLDAEISLLAQELEAIR